MIKNMSPKVIAQRVGSWLEKACFVVENDISRYDSAQNQLTFHIEYILIKRILGVKAASLWRLINHDSKFLKKDTKDGTLRAEVGL